MREEDREIESRAIAFAKLHRTAIARHFADLDLYPGEDSPVSLFMAGSPGAGKTEVARRVVALTEKTGTKLLHLDPDDFRYCLPGYSGRNSRLFQTAVTRIVERVHDLTLSQGQSFLLDGTLANLHVAERNIRRSLNRGRLVQILYVHQRPELAWEFVLAREAAEGRNIPCDEFVRQYFAAHHSVLSLMSRFGDAIQVDAIVKDAYAKNAQVHVATDPALIDDIFDCPYDPPGLLHKLLDTAS